MCSFYYFLKDKRKRESREGSFVDMINFIHLKVQFRNKMLNYELLQINSNFKQLLHVYFSMLVLSVKYSTYEVLVWVAVLINVLT